MAQDYAFHPIGPAVQILTVANTASAATALPGGDTFGPDLVRNYRFKWNGTADVFVVPFDPVNPDGTTRTPPTVTAPAGQYAGFSMLASTVEVFTLSARQSVIIISTAVGTLEIIPGDGL